MTDTLDTRATGMVKALMDAPEHPIRRPSEDPPETPSTASPEAPTPTDVTLPEPPERGSLDDEDLVPLVGRHTTDTATIDLIGILQAQMQLRQTEATRFAAWEQQMRRIGTDEALDALERTRLHFTGVIPVQTGSTFVSAASIPANTLIVPERITSPAAPIVTLQSVPEPAANVHDERARRADAELLEIDEPAPATGSRRAVDGELQAGRASRILLIASTAASAALVVVALVLSGVHAALVPSAVIGAVAVVGAAWIGIVLGRLALRGRGQHGSAPVTTRTAWAIVAGLVLGTALGEGLVRTSAAGFGWQGYLMRLVDGQGVYPELSLVAGIVASIVLSFVVVVLVDRGRQAR
ncbi:hypothetical protein AX769_13515 [Frondihabitans sp. PAMC 28766]|uniref:hypothetical protein n=1 Tax=Frondihabitans sp. PAMC 28766 TaxID=1795630 RepID=UPI00078BB464|nr:hypothetical protein [Frondihabitans sp. PAMC 28766]AMM20964.1 hypothetical protein AX769_13515 [Frondihabitans sp. PAMC 28766]